MSFEEAIKRLEEIVKQLENPEIPLEESLKLFEEGSALVRQCEEILDKAELRIKHLTSSEVEGDLTDEDG